MAAPATEKDLYPLVAGWLRKHHLCFKTSINTGLLYSRLDVVGVRDVGGDHCGEVETISVEVKRGNEPFATATGQALGYRVYANRIYLADLRETRFSHSEVEIASHLGVGLIRITGTRCHEELSSPFYRPITRMNLALLEKFGLGLCRLCGSVFQTSDDLTRNRFSKLTCENLRSAVKDERGLMFWNRELAERKKKLGIRMSQDDTTYERRFICPDRVWAVLSQMMPQK